jgi:hypothetical protein
MSGGDYEVGYCRPPVHTRFQKGRSGYPLGRKAGSRPVGKKAAHRIFDSKIKVVLDGKTLKLTRIEAALLKAFSKGMGGNDRALSTFIHAHGRHERLVITMRPESELFETQLPSILFVPVEARPAQDADWRALPPPSAEPEDG